MTNARSRSRKNRRIAACIGWTASMATAVIIGATLCFGGTQNCVLALLLFVGTAVLWHPWMKREGGVPVLVYHSVTSQGAWLPWSENISVTPEFFACTFTTFFYQIIYA